VLGAGVLAARQAVHLLGVAVQPRLHSNIINTKQAQDRSATVLLATLVYMLVVMAI
jgi:hypothetical protein